MTLGFLFHSGARRHRAWICPGATDAALQLLKGCGCFFVKVRRQSMGAYLFCKRPRNVVPHGLANRHLVVISLDALKETGGP